MRKAGSDPKNLQSRVLKNVWFCERFPAQFETRYTRAPKERAREFETFLQFHQRSLGEPSLIQRISLGHQPRITVQARDHRSNPHYETAVFFDKRRAEKQYVQQEPHKKACLFSYHYKVRWSDHLLFADMNENCPRRTTKKKPLRKN